MPPENNQNPIVINPGHQRLWGVLSYLGILVIIPFLVSKDDPFVKFHIKQGLIVFVMEIIIWVLAASLVWTFSPIIRILNLVTLVLSIIGIVNVIQNKQKELPVVGHLSNLFTF